MRWPEGAPAEAPRPEEVADVLELLDDGDTDLSAFLDKQKGTEGGSFRPADAGGETRTHGAEDGAAASGGADQPA